MNCRKSILLLIALSMLAALMACGGGSSSTTKTTTIIITANTGTGYTTPAAVGTVFGTFSATVTSNGTPAPNVSVTFTAPTAGTGIATGTFGTSATATDTETTNASGVATSATFTAGTVAGTYNVTATATGATTPATFSVTNAAGSPSTISISGSSTESAIVNTAFAPLAVLVVDGDGNPVNNANVTFTVVPGGTGASAAFATAGTTDTETTGVNGVYTTSQALTANANTGSFTVSADFTGDNNPVTFTLTNTAAASLLLNPGNYVFSVGGTDTGSANCVNAVPAELCPSAYFAVGVFTVDSSGSNITAGEFDFSDYNYFAHETTVTGSIAASATTGDKNLTITLNTGDVNIGPGASTGAGTGTLVLNAAMTPGNPAKGLISEYDAWASSSGEMNLQTSTAALCSTAPTTPCGYSFSIAGVDGFENSVALGGVLVIDQASGGISGTGSIFDANDIGTVYAAQTFSSGIVSAPIDAFGYITISLNSGSGFFAPGNPANPNVLLDGYIIDANHVRLIEHWNFGGVGDNFGGTTAGTLLTQTGTGAFNTASISGSSYVFRAFGATNTASTALQIAGVLNFVADGSVTGNISYNDLGSNIGPQGGATLEAETTLCSSGTATTPCYTVDSTGRVTVTNVTDGNVNYNLQFYLAGCGCAQIISMDATDVLNGSAIAQSGALTFSGAYALGTGGLSSTGFEINGDGQVGATPNTLSIAGYLDENDSLSGGGLSTAKSLTATYTGPTGGIVDVTGTGTNAPIFTIYVIDATQGVIIENDNLQLQLGYFTNQ